MLATLTAERFSDPGWLFERKFDGERCLAFGRGTGTGRSRVTLRSRNGNDITAAYPELADALSAAAAAAARGGSPDFVADGEIVAFEGGRTSFQLLQRRIHLRTPERLARVRVPVHLYLFDLLHLDGFDVSGLPLLERKRLLRRAFAFGDPIRLSAYRMTEGERLFAEACRRGWEGVIAKRADAPYTHARSKDWLKFKCAAGQEFVVGGFTDPKGSRVGIGALLVGYFDGPRPEATAVESDPGAGAPLVYAGKVGTGFDRTALLDLERRLRGLERPTSPFASLAGVGLRDAAAAIVHWAEPRLVVQVAFSEWTADGRLRHPSFQGLRDDKDPRDVIRERPT
jgi:DNA ligase D-like protein (predicted ligase)